MPKNILITGSNGQLGSEIRNLKNKKDNYFFTDVAQLNITQKDHIENFTQKNNIHIIVNCAAYTNVDQAEEHPNEANNINHKAVENLVQVCKQNEITLIHISTDYVFDGTKNTPYKETDPTLPTSVYGKTKLDGEKSIQKSEIEHIIIRTSWLYSSFGQNFVKTIQQRSLQQPILKVVIDQVGSPTNATDLAEFIIHIIEKQKYKGKKQIYHFSNEGICSWFDFATEIVHLSESKCQITPCLSEEFKQKAKRPNYSVLDKTKLKEDFQYPIAHWKKSLKKYINNSKK